MPTSEQALATAISLYHSGRLSEAEQACRQILAADPYCLKAWEVLGAAANQAGQFDLAAQFIRLALQIFPNHPDLHFDLGFTLQRLGHFDDALAAYRRALELKPDHQQTLINLGCLYRDLGNLDDSLKCLSRALAQDPNNALVHNNLGNLAMAEGKWDDALAAFERAISLNPNSAEARTNRALILLASGDYTRGWTEYEWRWKTPGAPARSFDRPRWNGESLDQRTILLHSEQGLGDVLQFVRYAPLVKARGAQVLVECPGPLVRLLKSCAGIDQVFASGEELPAFDFHAPLLSLPALFSTTLESVPADIPYLFADPTLTALWRDKLAHLSGFRIGINWRGRPGQGLYRLRDIPLECFASLTRLPVHLISLQKGASPAELASAGSCSIVHPGDDIDEAHGAFMDTAAILMNLDLIITSDTSMPHLAAALGRPVWLALPFVPSWQWLRDRNDSPWYPNVRLFRQKTPGDWPAVFQEIQSALQARLAK